MRHQFDPFRREHHVIVCSDEIEFRGHKLNPNRIPEEVMEDVAQVIHNDHYKHRKAVDAKRLAHFRKRFGPQFKASDLPRAR